MILAQEPRIEIVNTDCIQLMKMLGDKQYDLAIVDPPYGIFNGNEFGFKEGNNHAQKDAEKWDTRPTAEYFEQLFRVSKNQIIWGMQYFASELKDFSSIIVWDKKNGASVRADGEIAYCSIKGTVRIFRHAYMGRYNPEPKRIHPTQKPTKLYEWLLANYAEAGMKILDTHCGSGSSAIACYRQKFEFMGIEISKEYYESSIKRFKEKQSQQQLF